MKKGGENGRREAGHVARVEPQHADNVDWRPLGGPAAAATALFGFAPTLALASSSSERRGEERGLAWHG